jgi:hypothetical protein
MALTATGAWAWLLQANFASGKAETETLWDAKTFYASGRMVLDGQGDRLYDLTALADYESRSHYRQLAAEESLPFLNPPFVALGFAPLATQSLRTFHLVLFWIDVGLLALTVVAVSKLAGLKRRVEVLFVALYALSVFPVFLLFLQQQLTLLVCLSWLGFVGLHLRKKEGVWGGAGPGAGQAAHGPPAGRLSAVQASLGRAALLRRARWAARAGVDRAVRPFRHHRLPPVPAG